MNAAGSIIKLWSIKICALSTINSSLCKSCSQLYSVILCLDVLPIALNIKYYYSDQYPSTCTRTVSCTPIILLDVLILPWVYADQMRCDVLYKSNLHAPHFYVPRQQNLILSLSGMMTDLVSDSTIQEHRQSQYQHRFRCMQITFVHATLQQLIDLFLVSLQCGYTLCSIH